VEGSGFFGFDENCVFWGGGGGEDLSLYFKHIFLPSSCVEDL